MKEKNGILYPIFNFLFKKGCCINLVELFKVIAKKTCKDKKSSERLAVDIFIISKFIFLIIVWFCNFENCIITFSIWYLIIANLYTYFYYHVWNNDVGNETDRIKRRFLFLLLSFIFSICCFAYLYQVVYKDYFCWNGVELTAINSFFFSVSSALGSSNIIEPKNDVGIIICNIEFIITFIFVTILIACSIPNSFENKTI